MVTPTATSTAQSTYLLVRQGAEETVTLRESVGVRTTDQKQWNFGKFLEPTLNRNQEWKPTGKVWSLEGLLAAIHWALCSVSHLPLLQQKPEPPAFLS